MHKQNSNFDRVSNSRSRKEVAKSGQAVRLIGNERSCSLIWFHLPSSNTLSCARKLATCRRGGGVTCLSAAWFEGKGLLNMAATRKV